MKHQPPRQRTIAAIILKNEALLAQPMKPAEIKKLRKAQGISVAEFACALNISAVTIRRWEAGASRPRGPGQLALRLVAKHGIKFFRL